MSIEDSVLDYWKARSEQHDGELQAVILDEIRPKVEQITQKAGFLWCEKLERLMIECCLNYSQTLGKPFLVYFIHRMQAVCKLTYEQESKMLQAVTK